jgi:trk system potassium uptake protein TrkH
LAAILLIPLGVAVYYEFFLEKQIYFSIPATFAFLGTIGICLICSTLFRWWGRKARGTLYRKEGILLVVSIWFLTAAVGSCPFLITQTIKNPIDAYFETMSGLTTTGATIISPKHYDEKGEEVSDVVRNPLDSSLVYSFKGTVEPLKDPETGQVLKTGIEALGKPLLFWRSFMQWLGGMGIVVLFIAVLPALSMGGKFLYENEMPGISKEGMTPRIKETASLLWKIYLGLTLLQVLLLKVTNASVPLFDAFALSFSTISTGGFTVTNDGLLSYASIATPLVIAIFMIAGSINFTFYFHVLRGKFYRIYEPEFFLFLVILIFGCLLMSFPLWHAHSWTEALAQGSFMAISAQTTTGFSLVSYDLWPFVCQLLMLILMFIGGMSGSTTGGIKVIRYFVVLKLIKNKIESLFRPEVVRVLKVGDKEIAPKTASTVLIFFCIVIFLVITGTYLLVWDNHDLVTSIGTISSMINNTGLSFGGIGSAGSYAFLSPFSKIVCILWMVLGRLEYLSVLVLLVPAFWRKK